MVLAARARGKSPRWYYTRCSLWDLQLDIKASIANWAVPMKMILSAFPKGKKGQRGSAGSPHVMHQGGDGPAAGRPDVGASNDVRVPAWFRGKQGYRYTVSDLGPIADEHTLEVRKGIRWQSARRGTPEDMRPEYHAAAQGVVNSLHASTHRRMVPP